MLSNILSAIKALPEEYGEPDWDGYGANPVSEGSTDLAYRFAKILPEGVEEPHVGVDPDGWVVFEWYHDYDNQCIVSFSDNSGILCNLVSGGVRHDKTYHIEDAVKICQKIMEVAKDETRQ